MAVNYGLGTENAGGPSFGFFANNTQTLIEIDEVDTFFQITGLREVTIGSGAATDSFNYTPHNVFINRGDNSRIDVLTAGMYLISYTITTSGASNDDLGFQIKRNGTTGIEGRASTYSRSGDNFETGASVVTFLEINDYIQIFINNASAAANVNIENMNVSVVKLMQGGKRPL